MKKIILLLVAVFIVQSSFAASFKELQVIPHDSTNAFEMKIWFPVKAVHCKVRMRILDSKNKQVREFFNKKVKNGYYNIYWDKKDDSGNYVSAGEYKIATVSCDYKRIEPITVKYADGENAVLTSVGSDINNPSIELTLLHDSLHVSLEIVNRRKNLTASVFSDSLIVGETASFIWTPEEVTPSGNYYYKLKVNDFEQIIPFEYKK